MGVKSWDLKQTGASGRETVTGGRTYEAEYNVEMSDARDGPAAIIAQFNANPDLPGLGDPYNYANDFDGGSFCNSIVPTKKTDSHYDWTVVCSFGPLTPNQQQDEQGNPITDPLLARREFEFGFSPRQVVAWNATLEEIWNWGVVPNTRTPILAGIDKGAYATKSAGDSVTPTNSAGDVFDPAPFQDQSDRVMVCQMNLAEYDDTQALAFQDSLNNSDIQLDLTNTIYNTHIRIFKHQAKIISIGARFASGPYTLPNGNTATRYYWAHTFEIHIRRGLFFTPRPLGWVESYPDRGFNRSADIGDPSGHVDGAGDPIPIEAADLALGDPRTARIKDKTFGNPVSEPQMLDGYGQPANVRGNANDPGSVKPEAYIDLRANDEVDFTQLPIGFTSWTP